MGQTIVLPPFQSFLAANMARLNAGLPITPTPVVSPADVIDPTSSVAWAAGVATVTWVPPATSGFQVQFWASGYLSPGVSFVRQWKLIDVWTSVDMSPMTVTVGITSRWGTPVVGNVQWYRTRGVYPTGQTTAFFLSHATVA
ncbi:MAG: hypothetical protein ACRDRB_20855 [Pseudonocardiaceae bacterium]